MRKYIYCCECKSVVLARLTDGGEIYPHRCDLANIPFWKCDTCYNYVGCHYKSRFKTNPLGCIPSHEVKCARKEIHAILDPLWQNKRVSRSKLYAMLSKKLGRIYHTAELRSIEECNLIISELRNISQSFGESPCPPTP